MNDNLIKKYKRHARYNQEKGSDYHHSIGSDSSLTRMGYEYGRFYLLLLLGYDKYRAWEEVRLRRF